MQEPWGAIRSEALSESAEAFRPAVAPRDTEWSPVPLPPASLADARPVDVRVSRQHDFLSGGGTMGAAIRAHDWSATPLGVPESWPPSLRTAIRFLLATPQPTAIAWGPGLLELHNDAFAATIGVDTGSCVVGQPVRELCDDLWSGLGPLVESAMGRGESGALDDQLICRNRHGYAEEAYLTCMCSPLVDDGGGVSGVMIIATESTEHVLSVRRTAALRDIAAEGATVRSVAEGCQRVLTAVARHPSDIPFALLFLRDAERNQARLVASAALPTATAASPESIDLGSIAELSSWPVNAALRMNETVVVDDLLIRFGTLPAGNWPFAPRCAVVVPVTSPGRDEPDAVLVAGVSARHALDSQYRGFLELVAKQIAAAIAGGRVHEDEQRRAAARVAAQQARTRRRARLHALKAKFAGTLEERTRLAREIHDTIIQGVTGIALQVRAVLPRVKTSPTEATEALERIVELAEQTSRDARQAVWDMRPAALADGDFARAIEVAARRLALGTALRISVSVTGDTRRLSPKHQAVALSIVQEAIANVVRHAHARTMHVRLAYGSRRLRISVTDDGRGFAVATDFHSYAGHWGLLGMQERASGQGGALFVKSAPECGTAVTLVLPYGTRVRRESAAVRREAPAR